MIWQPIRSDAGAGANSVSIRRLFVRASQTRRGGTVFSGSFRSRASPKAVRTRMKTQPRSTCPCSRPSRADSGKADGCHEKPHQR